MTPPQSFLNEPFTTLLASSEARSEALKHLWRSEITCYRISSGDLHTDPYFEYYSRQCNTFAIEQIHCLPYEGSFDVLRVETHADIANVASSLTNNASCRRDIVQSQLTRWQSEVQSKSNLAEKNDEEAAVKCVETSINWAARLLTMVEIGDISNEYTARRPLLWEQGSLAQFIHETFCPAKVGMGQIRLEKSFHAVALERLAGIEIEWTDDLASHLSLRNDDQKLLVFHHASFLENANRDIFPPEFCAETLRTLALLFPSTDVQTRKWYKKQQAKHGLDLRAIRCPRLRAEDRRIENFHFWRERIFILKQVFDEAEPSTLSQWWYDRRKGPQWYTFWVAIAVLILTIFFGLIQSVEGALQVYKAWYPGQ